jgi:DNA-binding transcriptional ArsR family regulator
MAEPNRRRILEILAGADELTSGEIASHFHQTPASVSQHLGVLQDARLVSIRRAGARRYYRLREEGFRALRAYLDRFWRDGLSRLKAAAEAEQRRTRRHDAGAGRKLPRGNRPERRAGRA